MRTVRFLILASVVVIIGAVMYDAWRPDAPPTKSTAAAAAERVNAMASIWTGSPSCVGRSCHGGLEPRTDGACLQNEYTTISANDPHARAYQVLFEKRSTDMVRLLGRADGKAHEDARCLACHATPLAVAAGAPSADWALAHGFSANERWTAPAEVKSAETFFGVGCESCHGPASAWVYSHFPKPKSPRPLSDLLVTRTAVSPLDNDVVRAGTCAGCHVGASAHALFGERNVDHDLIAAGHPRLLFEFVSLQEAMPSHWKPKRRDATFDWFVGQMAGARASLKVLRERALAPSATWPEFAEFDCFACHHDLKEKSWRQRVSFGANSKPGRLPWNSWTYSVISRLLKQHQLPTKEWDDLRDEMAKVDPAARQTVLGLIDRAEARLRELDGKASAWRSKAGAAKLTEFLASPDWKSADSWEAAEQYYFALMALKAASDDADLVRRLTEFEDRRGFDGGFTSPRQFDPEVFFKDKEPRTQ
jgi:hypothetical protein